MADLPEMGSDEEAALRAQLKPRRKAPPLKSRQWFRTRDIIFSPVDDAIFSEALREIYPTVRFVGHEPWKGDIPVYPSIPEGRHSWINSLIVPPDGWTPSVAEWNSQGYYNFVGMPELGLHFHPSRWDWGPKFYPRQWAFDLPTLSSGFVSGTWLRSAPKDDPAYVLILNTWRIIRRIATNRYKGGHPGGNLLMGGDRRLMSQAKGGTYWIGHHALEWCNAAPRRMLDSCFRPCDDWAPPRDEWYQALRAVVLEKYGPGLGETPTEPDRYFWS